MKQICVLAFQDSPLSSISLPVDIFNSAGVFWNRLFGTTPDPQFEVSVVSVDGKPVRCQRTVCITPDGSLSEVKNPDLLIVSPITDLSSPLLRNRDLLNFLVDIHSKGTSLASICTGAFILAEAGLLNGRKATTHWGLSKLFKHRYPEIKLEINRTVTDSGTIYCSGGANAGADMCLYLVKKYCGSETAYRCARALLLDPVRLSQAPYEVFDFSKKHGDRQISLAQEWVEKNASREVRIEDIADHVALSRRTFERRFKKATGTSPIKYLQRHRIEKAKRLLETSNDFFDTITFHVGYQDPSTFRKIFQTTCGLAPSQYREKFRLKQY